MSGNIFLKKNGNKYRVAEAVAKAAGTFRLFMLIRGLIPRMMMKQNNRVERDENQTKNVMRLNEFV